MNWTTEVPYEYGWYWIREESYMDKIVEIFKRPGHQYLCTWDENYEDYRSVNKIEALWSGPINSPSELQPFIKDSTK